jgi:hypothetical protein
MKNNGNFLATFSAITEVSEVHISPLCVHFIQVGFEVLMAVSTKMAVFWVVVPCSLVEVYQRFIGPCCLHHQDYHL